MNMHWLKNTALALAVAIAPAMTAVAAEKHAERPFSEYGIVDAPLQDGMIVISDSTYHLTDQTTVIALDGKQARPGDLQHGTKVGFNMYGTRAARYISEIWILPRGFGPDTLADD